MSSSKATICCGQCWRVISLAAVKSRLGKAREKVDARTRENAQLRQDLSSGSSPAAEGTEP